MPELSIIIITRDEERNIRVCLESIKWADEIIVLDSGSRDGTVEICREYTAKVYETDWPGFGIQKNRALEKASGEWVLSVDADERVTEELRREIEAAIGQGQCDAYGIPRVSNYCGRFMRHGGWWPDMVTRLFRRGCGEFTESLVHERLLVRGRIGALKTPLIHYAFHDLEEVIERMNEYSKAGARMRLKEGSRGSMGRAIRHGLWMFFRTYILKAGFLDGREGFMLAISNAEGTYYRYLKLMYLQEKAAS